MFMNNSASHHELSISEEMEKGIKQQDIITQLEDYFAKFASAVGISSAEILRKQYGFSLKIAPSTIPNSGFGRILIIDKLHINSSKGVFVDGEVAGLVTHEM